MPVNLRSNLLLVTSVLLVGLALAILGAVQSCQFYRAEAKLRFERHADRLVAEVHRRMKLSAYGLMGARGVRPRARKP